jgi:hypothetical protein
MSKKIVFLSLFLLTTVSSAAQKSTVKKDIAQAQAFLKSKKNCDKAENLMLSLLKDSVNRRNERIHLVLFDAIRMQYEQNNEKMYLRQKVDTAAFFNLTMKMFRQSFTLDSIDAAPDEKGRAKIRYRSKHAAYLDKYRKNLFNGGAYFIQKQQYAQSYDFMDLYLNCGQQPLFSSYSYEPDSVAAYWALYSAYKMKCPPKVLQHAELAKRDSLHLEFTLQYLAETFSQLNDTVRYVATLHEGFLRFKQSPYFFTYLVDYYNSQRLPNSALDIVNIGLADNPRNELFLYAKSNILLNMGDYDGCISVCDSLISMNDSIAEVYYNAGAAWINKAFDAEKMNLPSQKKRQLIMTYYKSALPYMEHYRAVKPEEKDKWTAALYNIYLNLNMGREFEEIDRMLR